MCKKFIIFLLFAFIFSNEHINAQFSLDTVRLDDIRIYNKNTKMEFGLYTEYKYFEGNDDGCTVRFYPAKDVPFYNFPEKNKDGLAFSFYIAYNNYFSYTDFQDVFTKEIYDDKILINSVAQHEDIVISIVHGNIRILLTKETKPKDLEKYFKKSFVNFDDKSNQYKDRVSFTLRILKCDKEAYLTLIFARDNIKNDFIFERMSLRKIDITQ
jgi:hypothetical protein